MGDQRPDLGLGIDAAGRVRLSRLHPPAADLREAGIAVDLQSPGLIVRQMPVEHVELVPGHLVDEAADPGGGLIVPGAVQHHAPPAEPRRVGDLHTRHCHLTTLRIVRTRLQHLGQAHGGIEEAGIPPGAKGDSLWRHRQPVPLLRQGLGRPLEPDHTAGTDAHRPVQLVAEDVAQVRRRRPGRDVALGNRQDKGRREVEVLSRRPDLGRARGDGDPGLCPRGKSAESQAKPDHQGQPCGAWARSAVVSHAASRP